MPRNEAFENRLYGDRFYQRADPTSRLRMSSVRATEAVTAFLCDPSSERHDFARYSLRRLIEHLGEYWNSGEANKLSEDERKYLRSLLYGNGNGTTKSRS